MHPGCTIEQVYLYREPIDFRKAIDGLSVLVEQELGLSPFASALYVFTNRGRNSDQGTVLASQRILSVAKAPGERQIRVAA